MSGWSTLNTGVTGLAAAQRALDTIGQNVVNSNTPGYSRQRVELSSTGAPIGASLHTGHGAVFGGVNIDGVQRIRDAFLEATRTAAGGRMQALQAQSSALTGAERLLAEPGDTGLQAVLDDFYSAWHDLSLRPTDVAAGAVALERGTSVASQLRFVAHGISDQWDTARAGLVDAVSEINQAAGDLAKLNGRIREGVVAEQDVNELMDQRDLLVRKLGELAGASAVPGQDGQVSVSINGIGLVSGTKAETVTLSGATDLTQAAGDPPTLSWGTTAIPVASGKTAGLLSVLRSDLPDLSSKIDGVAVSLRDAVNAVHTGGFTLAGAAGGDFFSGTGAGDLAVVPTSASELAVASAAGVVDGANAMRLGDLSDDRVVATLLGGDGPSARWRDLSTSLGVTIQAVDRAVTIQDSVVAAADSAVSADAGVNLDEEMTNMLLWQRAYEASARVITAADQVLDILVNRTGLVGR